MFLDQDVFQTISNIASESNIDIVEFKGIFQVYNDKNLLNETTTFSKNKRTIIIYVLEIYINI